MKYIAVDYGETRTGLAECDPGEVIVTPITPQIEEKSMNKAAAAARPKARAACAQRQWRLSPGAPALCATPRT